MRFLNWAKDQKRRVYGHFWVLDLSNTLLKDHKSRIPTLSWYVLLKSIVLLIRVVNKGYSVPHLPSYVSKRSEND